MKKRPSVSKQKTLFITHFFVDQAPEEGLRKIAFLSGTIKDIKNDEYYYCFQVIHTYSVEKLEDGIKSKKIIKLQTPIVVLPNQDLWMDKYYNIFLLDISPNSTPNEIILNVLDFTELN